MYMYKYTNNFLKKQRKSPNFLVVFEILYKKNRTLCSAPKTCNRLIIRLIRQNCVVKSQCHLYCG